MSKARPVNIDELIKRLPARAADEDRAQVGQAFDFAREAHGDKIRESGELYLQHDLAVADTVNQIGIDIVSTTSGLLHDSLMPHTGKTAADLHHFFGESVTSLVVGLERLDPYLQDNSGSSNLRNYEVIRRAILTIVEDDLRIVLIRMADCLQDLRKAGHLDPEKQVRIAQEAKNIYAPLANRLGIWQIKWQLEDLSFRYLLPEQYREIAGYLSEKRIDRDRSVAVAIRRLQQELAHAGIKGRVIGRPKHIYSIFRKMEQKGVSFGEIYDVQAVRVILDGNDPAQCYQVLGLVHNLWYPIPREFDDYIARPKKNGYKSLHTAVIDDEGRTLEVQIRTRAMDEEAERGIAAHWAYKEQRQPASNLSSRVQILRSILDMLQEAEGQASSEGDVNLEVLNDRVFVFTPKGDVIDLPIGATPIDFAYHIHTEVGHRCRGAKINGKMTSLDYKLRNGDRVEIITASRGGPSRDWMNESLGYTGSARTRSKIRSWFREQEREQNIQQGREVVDRELRRLGVTDTIDLADIALALKYDDLDDFLAHIGFGDIQAAQISGAVARMHQKLKPDDELRQLLSPQPRQQGLTVLGVSGLYTRMAHCCSPVPPEGIIGYVTRGRGVTVHRRDCKQVLNINEPERLIEVSWGYEEQTYPIPIVITGYSRPGLMNDITNLLKGRGIPLTRTKASTANSVTTIFLEAQLASLAELDWLLRKLETLPNVLEVRRQRWNN